jgi:hypothetical protein
MNGGVVALELKLVVSVTMPSGSAEIAVPTESVMVSFNDVVGTCLHINTTERTIYVVYYGKPARYLVQRLTLDFHNGFDNLHHS